MLILHFTVILLAIGLQKLLDLGRFLHFPLFEGNQYPGSLVGEEIPLRSINCAQTTENESQNESR